MAADTVDAVLEQLGAAAPPLRSRRSPTARLQLRGAAGYHPLAASDDARTRHLADRYGGEARQVLALIDDDPALGEPLVPHLPYLRAEAVFAARHEMVRTLDDVLSRRTRARLLGRDDTAAAAEAVAALIGPELGWDDAEQLRQVEAYRASIAHERAAAALPETALDVALGV
jgi:glycerol-3-phosphate dehydrogenase